MTWTTSIPRAVVNITDHAELSLTSAPTVNAFNVTATFGNTTTTQKFYVNL